MLIPTHAIETSYAGRRFRSRLEARWAVFYTAIGIPWMYEPEGFSLDAAGVSVPYLPDFYLPQQHAFIEIKPDAPTADAAAKAERLARQTGTDVLLFFGQPGYHINGGYPYGQLAADGAWLYRPDGGWDNRYTWCICPTCSELGTCFEGRSARLPCAHGVDDKTYTFDDPGLLAAYDRANRARFTRDEPC